MSTQNLPTDPQGNIYYGPKTLKEAFAVADKLVLDDGLPWHEAAERVAKIVELHYPAIATELRKDTEEYDRHSPI